MLFSRIKKSNAADNVFQVVKNVNASTALTVGQNVTWATASTSPAVSSAAAICTEVIVNPTTPLPCAGIWQDTSTAAGSLGLMQIYGYHASVGAASATIHGLVIPDTTTAGRVKDGGADAYASGQIPIGEVVVAVASNIAGIHIKLM